MASPLYMLFQYKIIFSTPCEKVSDYVNGVHFWISFQHVSYSQTRNLPSSFHRNDFLTPTGCGCTVIDCSPLDGNDLKNSRRMVHWPQT